MQSDIHPQTPVSETAALVEGIAEQFAIEGQYVAGEEVNSGHINTTFLVTFELESGERRRYILQRINENVFKDPLAVMRNVECVTSHINWKVLRKKIGLGGQTLSLYPHKTGRFYGNGERGGIWRCYNYLEGCKTYDVVENARPVCAYKAPKATHTEPREGWFPPVSPRHGCATPALLVASKPCRVFATATTCHAQCPV